jgi:hypothetical protein
MLPVIRAPTRVLSSLCVRPLPQVQRDVQVKRLSQCQDLAHIRRDLTQQLDGRPSSSLNREPHHIVQALNARIPWRLLSACQNYNPIRRETDAKTVQYLAHRITRCGVSGERKLSGWHLGPHPRPSRKASGHPAQLRGDGCELRIFKRRQRAFNVGGLTWIVERSFRMAGFQSGISPPSAAHARPEGSNGAGDTTVENGPF